MSEAARFYCSPPTWSTPYPQPPPERSRTPRTPLNRKTPTLNLRLLQQKNTLANVLVRHCVLQHLLIQSHLNGRYGTRQLLLIEQLLILCTHF